MSVSALLPLALTAALALAACGSSETPPSPDPTGDDPVRPVAGIEDAQVPNSPTGAAGVGAPASSGSDPTAPPRVGLWVLAEGSHRTLEARERVPRLIADAKALGATDLFVQIYRGGRSWFASAIADATPHREILETTGGDTLDDLIREAHAADLRVHAWFNVLSLASNADAPVVRALGRDAVLVDRRGRSLLDYPGGELPPEDESVLRMGTPGVWLDPSTPGVVEHLVDTLGELVDAYPELDGLHLDFIRHPLALPIVPGSRFEGLDFGYGESSRKAFEAAQGTPFERGNAWDDFRRDAVTEVVRRLHARLPDDWEHSAAVLAYADRAYLSAMQDWRRWLEEDLLDFAVAMAYTRDDRLLRYLSHQLTGGVGGERVWLGLGTWLFGQDPVGAVRQRTIAAAAQPAGIVLFSYDALTGAPETLEALRPAPPAP